MATRTLLNYFQGASDNESSEAVGGVTGYDRPIVRSDHGITVLDGGVSLLRWMVGTNIALNIAILWRLFS